MTKTRWWAAAIAGLALAGCEKRTNDDKSQVRTAQRESEQALDKAASAQKEARSEQEEVSAAEKKVTKAEGELAEARAKAEKERGQATAAQGKAQTEVSTAQRDAQQAQQRAIEGQQQEQQQAQQQEAQAQQEPAQQEKAQQEQAQQSPQAAAGAGATTQPTVEGRLLQASGSDLTIKTAEQANLQLKVDSETTVTLNGKPSSMEMLRQGAQVRTSYAADPDGTVFARNIEAKTAPVP